MLAHLKELDRLVNKLEAQIQTWHRSDAKSRKLEKIPAFNGWKVEFTGDQQTLRLVFAHIAHSWSASGDSARRTQNQRAGMVTEFASASQQECGGGSVGQQECANGLGLLAHDQEFRSDDTKT